MRDLTFRIKEVVGLIYICSENKSGFGVEYAKGRFSHEAASFMVSEHVECWHKLNFLLTAV